MRWVFQGTRPRFFRHQDGFCKNHRAASAGGVCASLFRQLDLPNFEVLHWAGRGAKLLPKKAATVRFPNREGSGADFVSSAKKNCFAVAHGSKDEAKSVAKGSAPWTQAWGKSRPGRQLPRAREGGTGDCARGGGTPIFPVCSYFLQGSQEGRRPTLRIAPPGGRAGQNGTGRSSEIFEVFAEKADRRARGPNIDASKLGAFGRSQGPILPLAVQHSKKGAPDQCGSGKRVEPAGGQGGEHPTRPGLAGKQRRIKNTETWKAGTDGSKPLLAAGHQFRTFPRGCPPTGPMGIRSSVSTIKKVSKPIREGAVGTDLLLLTPSLRFE